jgi:hypothetical protein
VQRRRVAPRPGNTSLRRGDELLRFVRIGKPREERARIVEAVGERLPNLRLALRRDQNVDHMRGRRLQHGVGPAGDELCIGPVLVEGQLHPGGVERPVVVVEYALEIEARHLGGT